MTIDITNRLLCMEAFMNQYNIGDKQVRRMRLAKKALEAFVCFLLVFLSVCFPVIAIVFAGNLIMLHLQEYIRESISGLGGKSIKRKNKFDAVMRHVLACISVLSLVVFCILDLRTMGLVFASHLVLFSVMGAYVKFQSFDTRNC